MRRNDYTLVLQMVRGAQTLQSIAEQLRDLSFHCDDRDLRIYIDDVLKLLESPYLADVLMPPGSLPLPVDRPPLKTLVAYCERQLQRLQM